MRLLAWTLIWCDKSHKNRKFGYSQRHPAGSGGNKSACSARDSGFTSGSGRSPGEGNGSPLQYSGLQNSMDCIVHGVTKSWTRLRDFHFHTFRKKRGWGRSGILDRLTREKMTIWVKIWDREPWGLQREDGSRKRGWQVQRPWGESTLAQ